jgi:3-methyladenine DNA glycosylase Tag
MSEKKVTGVAQAIDLENISKDIAKLVRKLGKKAEGPVSVKVLKKVQAKIEKILSPAA